MKTIKTHSGEIRYTEKDIIYFPWGIIGFPESKRYILIDGEKGSNFKLLQSIDEPHVTFVVADPLSFIKDYRPNLTEDVFFDLDIKDIDELGFLSIINIPKDPKEMTANLKGPIIVNTSTRKAKQIIVDDERYSTRQYILLEILKEKACGQEGK